MILRNDIQNHIIIQNSYFQMRKPFGPGWGSIRKYLSAVRSNQRSSLCAASAFHKYPPRKNRSRPEKKQEETRKKGEEEEEALPPVSLPICSLDGAVVSPGTFFFFPPRSAIPDARPSGGAERDVLDLLARRFGSFPIRVARRICAS